MMWKLRKYAWERHIPGVEKALGGLGLWPQLLRRHAVGEHHQPVEVALLDVMFAHGLFVHMPDVVRFHWCLLVRVAHVLPQKTADGDGWIA